MAVLCPSCAIRSLLCLKIAKCEDDKEEEVEEVSKFQEKGAQRYSTRNVRASFAGGTNALDNAILIHWSDYYCGEGGNLMTI